jgi:hypothetical protein
MAGADLMIARSLQPPLPMAEIVSIGQKDFASKFWTAEYLQWERDRAQ